mgnify:CR=1 FL=1|jgi:hypothetical protein
MSDESNADAYSIAMEITKILVDCFRKKENRDPSNYEIQCLLEELTEERIQQLLGDDDDDDDDDDDTILNK